MRCCQHNWGFTQHTQGFEAEMNYKKFVLLLQVSASISVFIHIFAMVLLVCLTVSITRELHKRTLLLEKKMSRNPNIDYKMREMTIAFLLVKVVIVFIICHTLWCFLSFIDLVEEVFGMFKKYKAYLSKLSFFPLQKSLFPPRSFHS